MMKIIWRYTIAIVNRLLLILLWLIVLDSCTKLDDIPAILSGLMSLAIFYLVHVKYRKPKNWDFNRLSFVKPKYPLLLLFLALVLIVGDIFWIYHTKTSADALSEDPFDFLVLAIIAFPIIEEFGFRLWLQSYLETFMSSALAIVIVAIGFGLLHKPEMPIPQILSGVLYGIVLIQTKSIWIPILLHILHNAILIISGNIEYVQKVSFELMDRPGNLNLHIAISAWVLSGIGIYIWWLINNNKKTGYNNAYSLW
ncbi:MAG: CPBP family intramembrane metalloprotease [Cytophagia bacterium]|nr:CPBP family intramembrane metalloprotease [Cytophagia bacterium]